MKDLEAISETFQQMIDAIEKMPLKNEYSRGHKDAIEWAKGIVDLTIKIRKEEVK